MVMTMLVMLFGSGWEQRRSITRASFHLQETKESQPIHTEQEGTCEILIETQSRAVDDANESSFHCVESPD